MGDKYFDIHCHPDIFIFNRMRNTKKEKSSDFHLWKCDPPKWWEKGKLSHYSQSDFSSLIQGNVKGVIVSLHVLEKESFLGRTGEIYDDGLIKDLKKIRNKIIYKKSPLRLALTSLILSLPISRIKFFQSKSYDYFKELQRIYKFYLKDNNKLFKCIPIDKNHTSKKKVLGKYVLTKCFEEVEKVVKDRDGNKVAVILAIEGGHIFSKKPDGKIDTEQNILKKIDYVKNNWEYPVLFFAPAHLYYNGLCGQARGFPDKVCWIADQQMGMNKGLTDLGLATIKRWLSIDGSKGRRVLIDMKHMSPRARKDYYDKVVIPYNNKHPQNKIPIIFSHGAHSGVRTLNELIKLSEKEVTGPSATKNGFLATGLNFCDEEIKITSNSGGIIGLIMNERLLASSRKLKAVKSKKDPKAWARLLFAHIARIVKAIQATKSSSKDKQKAWNCITLGTDFDGFCNPPDPYYSAITFPILKDQLISIIKGHPERENLLVGMEVEEAVEKVMWNNAFEFLRRNFH